MLYSIETVLSVSNPMLHYVRQAFIRNSCRGCMGPIYTHKTLDSYNEIKTNNIQYMSDKGKTVNDNISMASFGGRTVRMWHKQTSALLSVKLMLQIVFHIIYWDTHLLRYAHFNDFFFINYYYA